MTEPRYRIRDRRHKLDQTSRVAHNDWTRESTINRTRLPPPLPPDPYPKMSPAPEAGGPPAAPPVKKSQKEMTKAERKALQEAQRAAKAARLEQQQAQKASGSKPAPSNQNAKSSSSSKPPAGSSKPSMHQRRMSIAASGAADDETPKYRGLRIFSHFGLPKAPGHQIKGDIHPAIIRLGLLFSEFKISGANARCIATLTAFKAVSGLKYEMGRSQRSLPIPPRLCCS